MGAERGNAPPFSQWRAQAEGGRGEDSLTLEGRHQVRRVLTVQTEPEEAGQSGGQPEVLQERPDLGLTLHRVPKRQPPV